jgi:hypothetical protein
MGFELLPDDVRFYSWLRFIFKNGLINGLYLLRVDGFGNFFGVKKTLSHRNA